MKLFSKKEENKKIGRPKLADLDLKKKSIIMCIISFAIVITLLVTGAFKLNIVSFNNMKGTAVTNLCGNDIEIIPEELRYSESNPGGFKDIKFFSAVLSGGKTSDGSNLFLDESYCSNITIEQLGEIKLLDTGNLGLEDASGIKYLKNLIWLDLSNNSLNSIDLSGMQYLKKVNLLNNNNLVDINLSNSPFNHITDKEIITGSPGPYVSINSPYIRNLNLDDSRITNTNTVWPSKIDNLS